MEIYTVSCILLILEQSHIVLMNNRYHVVTLVVKGVYKWQMQPFNCKETTLYFRIWWPSTFISVMQSQNSVSAYLQVIRYRLLDLQDKFV